MSSVKIVKVVHGFRDHYSEILPNKDKRGNTFQYNEAVLGCHDNVACYPQFDVASRGIVRLLRGGIAFCSGALTVSMHNGLYDWLIPYPTGNVNIDFITNTTSPCQSITFENKTLTEDDRIVCKNIILQDVTINSGATLLLQATERITVGSGVVVKTGGTVVVEGLMSINDGYIVEDGGSWIIK